MAKRDGPDIDQVVERFENLDDPARGLPGSAGKDQLETIVDEASDTATTPSHRRLAAALLETFD